MGLVWLEELKKFAEGYEQKARNLFAKKSDIPTYSEATQHKSGLMSFADKAKLDAISENANNYSLPAASDKERGGVKTGYKENGKNYPVQTDGNGQMFVNVPWTDTNTTYGNMKGASSTAAGSTGLVPTPDKGKHNSFLRGDGAWTEMVEATDADIDAIIAGTFK